MKEAQSENWVLEIGQYISLFCQIESYVFEILECLPQDKLTKHAVNFRDYTDRARMLQALLRTSDWDNTKEIEQVLEDTLPLAKLRNKLSHNPTLYDVYINPDTDEVLISPAIYDSRKGHKHENITYNEIIKKKYQLMKLAVRLDTFIIDIKKI